MIRNSVISIISALALLMPCAASAFEYFSVNHNTQVWVQPDQNSNVIAELRQGQVLLKIDIQGEWSKVFFLAEDKQPLKGWLLSSAIDSAADKKKPSSAVNSAYYISAVDKLRLREGPGTQFPSHGTLSRKQVVKRLETRGEWFKIKYKTATGNAAQAWVAGDFLKQVRSAEDFKIDTPAAEAQQSTFTQTAIAENSESAAINYYQVRGSKVNFREGPATSYPVLGQLNDKQQVSVIAEQGEWKKISYDLLGKEVSGWMAGRFLKPM